MRGHHAMAGLKPGSRDNHQDEPSEGLLGQQVTSDELLTCFLFPRL